MELEFLRWLRLAQGFGDHKSTMPMLANVLLRTQGKNQRVIAASAPEARWALRDAGTDLAAVELERQGRRGAGRPGSLTREGSIRTAVA